MFKTTSLTSSWKLLSEVCSELNAVCHECINSSLVKLIVPVSAKRPAQPRLIKFLRCIIPLTPKGNRDAPQHGNVKSINIYCQIRVRTLFRLFKDIAGLDYYFSRAPPVRKVPQFNIMKLGLRDSFNLKSFLVLLLHSHFFSSNFQVACWFSFKF